MKVLLKDGRVLNVDINVGEAISDALMNTSKSNRGFFRVSSDRNEATTIRLDEILGVLPDSCTVNNP